MTRLLALTAAVLMWTIPGAADDVVLAPAPDSEARAPDVPVTALDIYAANERGRALYSEGRFDEAYPLLLFAAQHGLKTAQAQVGTLHLHGLGGADRDPRMVVAWLGVAASGRTDQRIEDAFDDAWRQVPKASRPYYEKVIEAFLTHYGSDAHGVVCGTDTGFAVTDAGYDCYFSDARYGDVINDPYQIEQRERMDDFYRGFGGSQRGREYREYTERVGKSRGMPQGVIRRR